MSIEQEKLKKHWDRLKANGVVDIKIMHTFPREMSLEDRYRDVNAMFDAIQEGKVRRILPGELDPPFNEDKK